MSNVTPLPRREQETVGAFTDTRADGRALRVTWHHEPAPHGPVVLLSLWREDTCVGSFRLAAADVPALAMALLSGLDAGREAGSTGLTG